MLSYQTQLTYVCNILWVWPVGMKHIHMSTYILGSPADIFDECWIVITKEDWEQNK